MPSGRGIVAVVQDAPVLVDWRATVDKAARLTADGRDIWHATIRHIAYGGRCFVLSCNPFVTRSMKSAAASSTSTSRAIT